MNMKVSERVLLLLIRHWKRDAQARWCRRFEVVTFENKFLFWRHEVFWRDEWFGGSGKLHNPLPWWCPINAFLHWWKPAEGTREGWHDHPRWSITVCLRGRMIEHTPWGDHVLTPGSIMIRSHKAIHAFSIPPGYSGKTWTLFIVGRRKHRQNAYVVTPR